MKDIYQAITNQIIEALQQGTAPWTASWTRNVYGPKFPFNRKTGAYYHGINSLMLQYHRVKRGFNSNAWLTFRQALDLGGNVRKGETGVPGIFFTSIEVQDKASQEKKSVPMARAFHVFNLDQIDGIALDGVDVPSVEPARNEQIEQFLARSGADIRVGGTVAVYYRAHDMIQLPSRERFKRAEDYYATALHELVHWTGHASRLDRQFGAGYGDRDYAFEELVAEIGSSFLCSTLGIEGDCQHVSYLAEWLEVLESDKRAIVSAASKAQAASDYLVGLYQQSLSVPVTADTHTVSTGIAA